MATWTAVDPKMDSDVTYYPEDRLPWPQTTLLGIQHVMAMFGATVLVPLILGFNVNTVLFFSGVATLIFIAVTGGKVPSYLGSSFSFIGSVLAIQGGAGHNQPLAFAGIFVAGALYFIVGVIVHLVGGRVIRFFMPPVVTGTVVAVIGLALAGPAWASYSKDLFTATVTVLAAAIASVYLRGFLRLLPILAGIVVGYVVALLDPGCAAATAGCHVNLAAVSGAAWLGHPQFSFPPQFTARAVSLFWFIPIVLIAENAGHVYAISGLMKRDLSGYLGRTFMGDGLGTMLSALFGGTGETTYAENIGVMGVTRVFSIPVYLVAAVVAILLGFVPKFGGLVNSIPASVLGGIELYLFGLIAAIGGKIWVDGRVDFSNRANLATVAIPLILAASGADVKAGASFEINNLGLGALGAIVLYQILRPGAGRPGEPVATADA
ncbi:MAG: uracil-xanthine permease family protein [bacterium]